MVLPDINLLQAAIVLAEELHFGRAADRLNMTQPTLSKQIFRLERSVGLRLFEHSHQAVELTPAGQIFIAEAREVIFHAERAIISARAVVDGSTEVLNFGKSSYTDPFLVSLLTSIELPLFRAMRIKLWSNYSNVLAQQLVAGTLDVALVTGVPSKSKLSTLEIANDLYYIAMPTGDELAVYKEDRPLIMRIPAKIRPPKQITAPAYMAKVLNVDISV